MQRSAALHRRRRLRRLHRLRLRHHGLKTAQEASLARQKLESLGVLARGIAHDFNNLLGGIHANAELAEVSQADSSFPGGEIQTIKAISMRASEIVRQLMIYAGNEGSTAELLDLSHLVKQMLDLIRISVSKSVVLKTDLGNNLPALLGNAPQIQQVVMNLVLNASEALNGNAGAITVRTALGTSAGPASNGFRNGKHSRLEISDDGSGISKEAQARIFDPFTTKSAGRGLGLAVVQGVVRAHKGAIELTSVPGQGTTFRVLWPIAEQLPLRTAGSVSDPRGAGARGQPAQSWWWRTRRCSGFALPKRYGAKASPSSKRITVMTRSRYSVITPTKSILSCWT